MKNKFTILIAAILFVAAGCSKNDKVLPDYVINSSELTLHYDKDYQFKVKQGETDIDPENLTWTSSDETVGSVDSKGLFKAKKLGETTITGTSGTYIVKSEIIVETYKQLFIEPVLEFGLAIGSLKGKEKRELLGETTEMLLYGGDNNYVKGIVYSFKSSKLSASIAMIDVYKADASNLAVFLNERYKYEGSSDDIIFYSGDGILLGVGNDKTFGFNISYIDRKSIDAVAIINKIDPRFRSIRSIIR